jgi:hypothetical protein
MGALILVLVVVVQQAQVQAATAAGKVVAEQQSELKTEREMAQWRISQMGLSLCERKRKLNWPKPV